MSWSTAAIKLAQSHKLSADDVMHEAQRVIDRIGTTYGNRLFFMLTDGLSVAAFRVDWQPRVAPSIDVA